MKRTVPLLITGLVGAVLVVSYFMPWLNELSDLSNIFFDILAAIAFILGGGNLIRSHGEKIFKQQAGWGYSSIAVITFLVTLAFGLFKIGVTPLPGVWTGGLVRGSDRVEGFAIVDVRGATPTLQLSLSGAAHEATYPVRIGDRDLGTITTDEHGHGTFTKKDVGFQPQPGASLQVGDVLTAALVAHSRITGDYDANGSGFWFMYQYGYQPLQQTTFAMLAFYVASAAFRAFRARNIESVLLLGTAFVILLGRTFVGTWMTSWLPAEGPASFFQIPILTSWIMSVWNTAGNRAIMIGIALGVASTSLKVLLGVDRSYLGSDKG